MSEGTQPASSQWSVGLQQETFRRYVRKNTGSIISEIMNLPWKFEIKGSWLLPKVV